MSYKPAMDIVVAAQGNEWQAQFGAQSWRCAIGRGGTSRYKREGDGTTPIGRWPLRRLLYRPDRLSPPDCALPVAPLKADDGWCDDPADPHYNQAIKLPFGASHERLWRDDGIYDVIVTLGHNDDPPLPGAGSAIFLHVARNDYAPTEGCIALARSDLLTLLAQVSDETCLRVESARR